MSQTDNLSTFGQSFQTKVLAALLTDRGFLERIRDIIHPEFFESDANTWVSERILDYYDEYSIPPTLEVFKILIKTTVDDDIFKAVIIDQLRNIYKNLEAKDIQFVKDQFSEFCKNQRMKSALLKSVDYMQAKNWDAIAEEIKDAQRVGEEFDIGHEYFDDIKARLSEEARLTVHTPWDIINSALDGGLGPGELGVVLAPTGGGKSWMLSKIAQQAILDGKNVIHYTLELSEKYMGRRYDSIFSGIPSQNILSKKKKITRILRNIKDPGNLVIKFYPQKTVTTRTIKSHIEKLIALGKNPNLIIIDYGDLLKQSNKSSDSKYDEMGGIYDELRGMAGELQLPIWTASQTNRSAVDKQVIQADSMADSFAKAMIADFIMSVSRTNNDKVNDKARIHIVKNRFGSDGMTFPAKMDLSIGYIEIYDVNSSDGVKVRNNMKNDEETDKEMIFKRYKSMKGSNKGIDEE